MPWQLRPGDETVIREQIDDAKATVAREVAEFEARYPPEAFVREDPEPTTKDEQPEEHKEPEVSEQPKSEAERDPVAETETASKEPQEAADTADAQPKQEQSSEPTRTDAPTNRTNTTGAGHEQADVHHDDGGEVVEDNEDTVIY